MAVRPELHSLSRRRKYLTLGALYFSQGIPFGLFVQALPVLLREGGSSLQAIGLSSLLAIPWALKFAWSPWLDRRLMGLPRRKGWLIPLQIITTVALLALSLIDPFSNVEPLLAGILFINFLNATQDIATDGLAVEILSPEERGFGNGLQVGGYRVGMVYGGAGALAVIDLVGWSAGLIVCAVGLVIALVPLLLTRETREDVRRDDEPHGLAILTSYLRTPGALRAVAVLVAFKFGDALASGMLRPMLVDWNLTMADIGLIVGFVGFAAGLLGAFAGGLIGDRLSRRQAIVFGAALQAVGGAFYIPLSLEHPSVVTAAWMVGVEHFTGGIATVVLFTCMMDWCRPEHTGADYTVLASTVVIATGVGSGISGFSAAAIGYTGHFVLSVGLAIVGGFIAVRLFPEQWPAPPSDHT